MTNEQCNWYKNIKHKSPLDDFINERTEDIPGSYCEKDKQTFVVNYIQCVKLYEIEKTPPWSIGREDSIKKWATPDKLRRLKYQEGENGSKRCISHNSFHDMPMLSREYKLNNKDQEKFTIHDGIHRINRARELGIDCILASIEESVQIDKADKENVETKI